MKFGWVSRTRAAARFSFSGAGLVLLGMSLVACKNKAGDACKNAKEASCLDGASALVCYNKVWTKLGCRGAKGCQTEGAAVVCDESFASTGEFCDTEDNVTCSLDKHAQLRCERGQWRLDATCRGAEGCVAAGDTVKCDDTIAVLEDRCAKEGTHTCNVEHTGVLVCKGKAFVLAEACRAPSCAIKGTTVGCN
jgi:hypothetical protein